MLNGNSLEATALQVLYDDALAKAGTSKHHDDKAIWVNKAIVYARAIEAKEREGTPCPDCGFTYAHCADQNEEPIPYE